MPDVGLFSATEPLSDEMKVVIKYAVEVNGLPVYQESYSVETLAQELEQDEERALRLWARRIRCVAACRKRRGFSGCITRCLKDGKCADCGHENETSVESC